MLPPLSHRLAACCQFVRPGDRVADVGCDHGYLGIYLLQKNIAASVIASDVALQPLASARENARKYGVEKKISFHLCICFLIMNQFLVQVNGFCHIILYR